MFFYPHKILFGNGIDPSCRYCAFRVSENPDGTYICSQDPQHAKEDDGRCADFHYDPLMRKPRGDAPLPRFRAEDFKL